MRITSLVDNESSSTDLHVEHGLSLYIETRQHKILFDLGQGSLFLENAQHLGVDLSTVDTVIISHGHYDHGGGLSAFLEMNKVARIYLSKEAFQAHYSLQSNGDLKYIGLDPSLEKNDRLTFIDQDTEIDSELKLVTGLGSLSTGPKGNKTLYRRHGLEVIPDDFHHEMHLVVSEGNQSVLFSGCAHGGILAILDQLTRRYGKAITTVISGFHLHSHSTHGDEDSAVIQAMAESMMKMPLQFYTCHCTGKHPYMAMKLLMGAQLDYLAVGTQIELN